MGRGYGGDGGRVGWGERSGDEIEEKGEEEGGGKGGRMKENGRMELGGVESVSELVGKKEGVGEVWKG